MGCKSSKPPGEKYNKDVEVKRRFMTGIHISRGADGIEGNIQIGLGTTKHKKYERVSTITEEQQAVAITEEE